LTSATASVNSQARTSARAATAIASSTLLLAAVNDSVAHLA
jgi:hypothetical protein